MKKGRLSGITIVVTRPEPAATKTVQALNAEGAQAVAMPLLNITPLPVQDVVATHQPLLASLGAPTKVIFVSSHAVQFGLPVLRQLPKFFAQAEPLAIGATTAAQLTAQGMQNVAVPASGEDSEALLADPMLQQIYGQTIVIVKGESEAGGRALLAETLAARGARVVNMVCYRRAPVVLPPAARAALRQAVESSTYVLAGSVETLDALELNGGEALLSRMRHLLVPHVRIANVAMARGVPQVSVVSLEDNNLIDALAKMAD